MHKYSLELSLQLNELNFLNNLHNAEMFNTQTIAVKIENSQLPSLYS